MKLGKGVKALVRKRDSGTCQRCGTKGTQKNPLTVHHMLPKAKYPHLKNELSNLILLCDKCHKGVHHV